MEVSENEIGSPSEQQRRQRRRPKAKTEGKEERRGRGTGQRQPSDLHSPFSSFPQILGMARLPPHPNSVDKAFHSRLRQETHAMSLRMDCRFSNTVDINRMLILGMNFPRLKTSWQLYKSGSDYVGWHADDEKLYGPTPEIASVSFGCEREFLLRRRPNRTSKENSSNKRLKRISSSDNHSFVLKHGSLLVMRGYMQRDWIHSVPKRAKADSLRINLTFRFVQTKT